MTAAHAHRWDVAALPVDGRYDATCACGAAREFPMQPETRQRNWSRDERLRIAAGRQALSGALSVAVSATHDSTRKR